MKQIEQAMRLKKQLDGLRPFDAELEASVQQKLRLDWNYHSNHLEGNSLTYGETKALILFGITAQGKPLKDHTEVEGHDEAVKWLYELIKDDRPLTENFIRELHTQLLVKPYKVQAMTGDGLPTSKIIQIGRYKNSNNHVETETGEIYHFTSFQETPMAMQALLEWYKTESEKPAVNPILLAAGFHHKFIQIHPFDDGNGRVVRLLMNYILMKFGYPPVIIKTEDKKNYFSNLQLANAGNIEAFFEYIAENLNHSLNLMIRGLQGASIEEPDDFDKRLALLDQKLNHKLTYVDVFYSHEAINIINKEIIPRFTNVFESNCLKFDKYYQICNFFIFGDFDFHQFHCVYNDFKFNEINSFKVEYNIKLEYNQKNFKIIYLNKFILKKYDDEFTNDEMNAIMKEINDAHLVEIDALIANL
jgi:Fic family protein